MSQVSFNCQRQFSIVYLYYSTQLIHWLAGTIMIAVSSVLRYCMDPPLFRQCSTLDIWGHFYRIILSKSHDSHVSSGGGVSLTHLHLTRWVIWKDSRLVHILVLLATLGHWALLIAGMRLSL